ncbi:PREDICTED: uncharacterized protein LOC109338984 [Lupinus angustifolius]|uniref:uncharacterized protein LOC109338984 n=1 Tax=Lupinus angustifolius TaxID=3871 RepID=UPI00092EB822|nr:PREDICTED: uncharacterized protein LOC109338984 [Lupinus angustifolius]
MVDDLYYSGNLSRGCNASFTVLIPKNNCPQGLGEYRPISLVGCIYKIISKLLVGRLKKVIHVVISECQTVFINGRYIMDGVVIANDIIDQARKKKNGDCFIFKVDFEKAYDSVNWGFILYMMDMMGFCSKWRSWIKSCLQSSSVSIVVNGNPTKECCMARGLRQDDTLLMEKNSSDNVMALKSILKCFELVSGLKINFHKSNFIDLKSKRDFVHMAIENLCCEAGAIPFKFLGIPANGGGECYWREILYGEEIFYSSGFGDHDLFKRGSSWWRDLGKLLVRCTKLTLVTLDKEATINSLSEWRNGVWFWNLKWRRSLFHWEQEEVVKLVTVIEAARLVQVTTDGWIWMYDK